MFKFPWAWLWKRLQWYNEDKEIVHAKRLWVAIISKARHALTLRLRMQHSVCILNNITRLKDERDRLEMKRYKFFKKNFCCCPQVDYGKFGGLCLKIEGFLKNAKIVPYYTNVPGFFMQWLLVHIANCISESITKQVFMYLITVLIPILPLWRKGTRNKRLKLFKILY